MKSKLILTAIFTIALVLPGAALADRSMSTVGGKNRTLDYSRVIRSRTTNHSCVATTCGPKTSSAPTSSGKELEAAGRDEGTKRNPLFRARCLATSCLPK